MREKKWLNIKFFTIAFISLISVVAMVFTQYGYGVTSDVPQPPANAIDPTHEASITVHKLTAPSSLTDSKGLTADPTPTGKPVAGVKFAISVVDSAQVNLLTNKGWETAAKIIQQYKNTKNLKSITVNGSPLKLYHVNDDKLCGTPSNLTNMMCNNELVTNAQGEVKFGGISPKQYLMIAPHGFKGAPVSGVKPGRLYFIQEIDASNATVDGKKVDVSPSEPFFVSVPLTNQKDPAKWVYDINVYPKNAVVSIKKSVDDANSYTVGQKITYHLTSDIPGRVSADGLNKYVVMDQLSDSVQYVAGDTMSVAICAISGSRCNTSTTAGFLHLSSPTDYTVTTTNNLLKFTFTTQGLKKLSLAQNDNADRDADKKVKVRFDFTVKIASVPSKEDNLAVINNQAYLVPDNHHSDVPPTPSKPGVPTQPTTPGEPPAPGLPPEGTLPPIPSNNVKVKFAKVKFHKVDQTAAPLAGAKFQIWANGSETNACSTLAGQILPVNAQGVADPAMSVTSDASGNVVFNNPLHVSDYINDQVVTDNAKKIQYCLVETEAPQGYEKLPQPIAFTVDSNQVNDLVYTYGKDIVNVKHNAGFNLPLTGSSAMVILTVMAGASIAGAFFFLFKRRKSAE